MVDRPFLDMPDRIMHLPRDDRGYPVPRFVMWIDGQPDFRIIKPGWMDECMRKNLCWLCGGYLGRRMAFVIGPMCCVNRINSEPPSHYACARFAARNCPFLTRPMAKRRERDMPAETVKAPGIPIDRNPGVCAIWVTTSYKTFHAEGGDILFRIGPAETLEFWCEGRPATRVEVDESVRTGLPLLQREAQRDGPEAIKVLQYLVEAFTHTLDCFLPPEEETT
jgi:hypothetical protein